MGAATKLMIFIRYSLKLFSRLQVALSLPFEITYLSFRIGFHTTTFVFGVIFVLKLVSALRTDHLFFFATN